MAKTITIKITVEEDKQETMKEMKELLEHSTDLERLLKIMKSNEKISRFDDNIINSSKLFVEELRRFNNL